MARETIKHNGATREDIKVVGTFNCNYEPYEMITYQNLRLKAMEKHIEDLENESASIFLTAFKEGL